MKFPFRTVVLLAVILVAVGCTRMPADYHDKNMRLPATGSLERDKLELVATTAVGSSAMFRDYLNGSSIKITVESEYFSANGRLCRKFTERQASAKISRSALGCQSASGWVEIPVALFAG